MDDDVAKELNERAKAVMAEERWREAIEIIEAEPKLLEADASLSWNLGWAYFKLDDYVSAERHLAHASRLQPGLAAAWWARQWPTGWASSARTSRSWMKATMRFAPRAGTSA